MATLKGIHVGFKFGLIARGHLSHPFVIILPT